MKTNVLRNHSFVLALTSFLVSISIQLIILYGYGLNYSYDSYGYVKLGKEYFDFSNKATFSIRTLPYPFLNGLLSSWVNPIPLIMFQMVVHAFSKAIFIYVLGRKQFIYAVIVSFFLTLDISSSASTRIIHAENIAASCLLISLAMLLSHWDNREKGISLFNIFASGFFFMVAFSIRANLVPILILVPFLYLVIFRSFRFAIVIFLGIVLCFVSMCSFNLLRTGEFSLNSGGSQHLMAALLINGLLDSRNGKASYVIAREWSNMYPEVNPHVRIHNDTFSESVILLQNFRSRIYSKYKSKEEISKLIRKAYFETLLNKPFKFILTMGLQFCRAITVRADFLFEYYVDTWWRQINAPLICDWNWCNRMFWNNYSVDGLVISFYHGFYFFSNYHMLLSSFFLHYPTFLINPPGESHAINAVNNYICVVGGLLWFVITCIMFILSDTRTQFIIIICFSLIILNISSFVLSNAILPRYLTPTIPMQLILGAPFWYLVFSQL